MTTKGCGSRGKSRKIERRVKGITYIDAVPWRKARVRHAADERASFAEEPLPPPSRLERQALTSMDNLIFMLERAECAVSDAYDTAITNRNELSRRIEERIKKCREWDSRK